MDTKIGVLDHGYVEIVEQVFPQTSALWAASVAK